ncbi:MAG: creatininase family protein [Burkholderiales bacterium]|nr:creatininase family protein [Burkholderiales bacterium]
MTQPSAKRYWRDLSCAEIDAFDRARTVVVLPVSAMEQHGPHLPVSVDTSIMEALIERTVARLPPEESVLFLPVAPVGKSNEHARYPGTLSLSADTVTRLWMDLGESVAASGFKRLVIFNSHGGQMAPMDVVARDLRARHGMLVAKLSWYQLGLPAGLFEEAEVRHGIHAGDIETSMMLAIAPRLVRMDRARDFTPLSRELETTFPLLMRDDGGMFGWQMQDLNAHGAAGNAALATPAKGQQVLDHVCSRMVAFLAEVARFPIARLSTEPALMRSAS